MRRMASRRDRERIDGGYYETFKRRENNMKEEGCWLQRNAKRKHAILTVCYSLITSKR